MYDIEEIAWSYADIKTKAHKLLARHWKCQQCEKLAGVLCALSQKSTAGCMLLNYRVGQKNGLFLRVDNFTTVNGRKACDMSKVSEFCLELSAKLAFQSIQLLY